MKRIESAQALENKINECTSAFSAKVKGADGKRAIVVVLGSQTSKLRDEHARKLMVDALDKLNR